MGKPLPYPALTEKQVAKFWSKVDTSAGCDGCWPWKAKARTESGRGIVRVNKQSLSAARVAYEQKNGPCPPDLLVYQTCLKNECCNPAHLTAGTQSEVQAFTYAAEHGPPKDRKLAQRIEAPRTGARTYPALSKADKIRFRSYIDRGGQNTCWPWIGARFKEGYGAFRVTWATGARTLRAHRVAYILAHGSVPNSEVVRHTCDNPPCCNPKHLIPGTQLDNTADRKERMRCDHVRGERHPRAKLTQAQVDEIRRRLDAGESQEALAEEFDVHPTTISNIGNDKTWTGIVRC